MPGELGSQDGPSPTGTIAFTRRTGPNSHHAAPKSPSNCPGLVRPRWLLTRDATSRAWDNPVVSLPPETAGGPVVVASAQSLGLVGERIASPPAGVIVVELVLVDRLGGPPVEGYPWDVKTGLRLVRIPGFGGMPLPQWRLG